MMDRYDLQKLRDLPVEGVAERLGLRVERHKALCPFHDDHHASLSFRPGRGTWRCFTCGAHGGTIDRVMRCLGKDFLDACRWLADGSGLMVNGSGFGGNGSRLMVNGSGFGVNGGNHEPSTMNHEPSNVPFDCSRYERFFLRPWLSDEARRFLFDERRLDPRVVRWCRLTSWRDKQGVPWLQIPYYDREGRLIGIQNRNLAPSNLPLKGEAPLSPSGEGTGVRPPRFRFPAGSACRIYNLPVLGLLRPGEALYITEGCSDCWAMLSAGHKAVAIPSATLLKPADVALLTSLHAERGTPFHMYPDRDEPGERLFLQLRDLLPNLQHHQLPPGCKDFGESFAQKGQQVN